MNVSFSHFPVLHRIAIVTVGLILSSCTRPVLQLGGSPFNCPTTLGNPQTNETTPQSLQIEVHIDGSGSMIGYVPSAKPDETDYSRMLEFLHSLFVDNQDPRFAVNPPLKYFRTGFNKDSKETQQAFQFKAPEALDPRFKAFYAEQRLTSQLQSAINPPPPGQDKLSILISDLDQDQSAIQKVTQAIQTHFLSAKTPAYSVALLGIMSQFDGTVYSTDPQKISDFPYKGSRPIYLLWIGTNDRLEFYLEKFTKKLKKQDFKYELSIFSPQGLTQGFALESSAELPLPDGINSPFVLDSSDFVLEQQNAMGELLLISSRAMNGESKTTPEIPYILTAPSPNTFGDLQPLVVDLSELKTDKENIKSWKFNPEIKTETPEAKMELENPSLPRVELKNLIQTGNRLQFQTIIDLNSLDPQVIYPYRFDLIASDLNTQDWWQTWDWNKRSNNEDGSKTYQLLRFMESLQTATLKALPNNGTIGSLCFAVQKN